MADDVFEKVDLPSGGWVAFRDPRSLTERQRKPLKRARNRVGMARNLLAVFEGEKSPADLEDSEVDLLEGLMESVAFVLIDEWSVTADGEPVEPSIDALGDLMPDDYEALIEAAGKHRNTLIPNFEPAAREDEDGNENPTGPSPASKTRSAGDRSPGTSPKTSSEPGGS